MSITLEQVRKTLTEVVADFGPETTYAARYEEITGNAYDRNEERGCKYQVGGTPACIAGVVLHRLGVSLRTGWDADGGVPVDTLGLDVTRGAGEYLQTAQDKQDAGFSWGYSLAEAERFAERVAA